MSWFGAEIDGPMVVTRAIHFAATATTAGALIFRGLVAEPALRGAPSAAPLLDKQVRLVAWIGLALTLVSGLTWVLLLTMSLSDEERRRSGDVRGAARRTQFDAVWIGVTGPLGTRDHAGDLSGSQTPAVVALARARGGRRSGRFHRLDRTCCVNDLHIGVPASCERCATSCRRLSLDRWLGAARAFAPRNLDAIGPWPRWNLTPSGGFQRLALSLSRC